MLRNKDKTRNRKLKKCIVINLIKLKLNKIKETLIKLLCVILFYLLQFNVQVNWTVIVFLSPIKQVR